MGKAAVVDALKGLPPLSIAGKQALAFAKAELADKWENYLPAEENARASAVDLFYALELVKKHLKSKRLPVLLIHSMGNYLLENAIKNLKKLENREKLPMNFSNIVLHQADVTVPGYEWINKLNANLIADNNARLYVTTNFNDYVLLSSKGRRGVLKL